MIFYKICIIIVEKYKGAIFTENKNIISAEDIKRVKGLGCLQDKRYDDIFNVRVITGNGKISTEALKIITEAADKFGSGEIAITTRLTTEIQGVKYENIISLIDFLNKYGIETGGTGALVRPVVSCKGTTCQYGLIDTYNLSHKIHERFYKGYHNTPLPHKFKIAVGGCPNNCVKPDLNDLGIVGQRKIIFDLDQCKGCTLCQIEKCCPIHIAKVENNLLYVADEACNHCGRCLNKCPFGVTAKYKDGYKIYIGGRWGKKTAIGKPVNKFFTDENEVMEFIDRVINLFKDEGIKGERFADTINRLGFENAEYRLLNK